MRGPRDWAGTVEATHQQHKPWELGEGEVRPPGQNEEP